MKNKLILSVGMPRAGSGWFYNLTHDLVVAAGHQDARKIRERYRLQAILTEVNLNIGALTPRRLLLVVIPVLMGNTYVIKAHAGPTPMARFLIRRGLLQPAYIHRDPRDALLSAYEYGQRARQDNRENAFSRLTNVDQAIAFMQAYVRISQAWRACPDVLHVRYEDLLLDYENEAARLITFLGLNRERWDLSSVIDKYRPERGRTGQQGLHLVRGKIGRFREAFTNEEKAKFLDVFGEFLKREQYAI
ncbi:MAG TPA: sulfotransferase [Anaerolineales bacterium]